MYTRELMNILVGGLLAIALLLDPSPRLSVTPEDGPVVDLVLVGRLARMSNPGYCGYFYFGSVAEYEDLRVLEGSYPQDKVYVVHGCTEMPRAQFNPSSGSLDAFRIGDYHRLRLVKRNVYNIEAISYGCCGLSGMKPPAAAIFFAVQVDLEKRGHGAVAPPRIPSALEPPVSAPRFCSGHLTGVTRPDGKAGSHITWTAYYSRESRASLTNRYLEFLGFEFHAREGGCDIWRLPLDAPVNVLELCEVSEKGPWDECAVASEAKSIIMISSMAGR